MCTWYFENEVLALQRRFNETFGNRTVCHLQTRGQVILAILGLALLKDAIAREENETTRKRLIADFIRKRTMLHGFLDLLEEKIQEKEQAKSPSTEHEPVVMTA